MERQRTPSRLVRVAAALLGKDVDVLSLTPLRDQRATVVELLILLLVSGGTGTLWFIFLYLFYGLWVAIPGSLFAFAFIFLVDSSMGAAHWELTGILRKPGTARWTRDAVIALAFRVFLTGVASTATSTGAEMAMFHEAIEAQEEVIRNAQNDATQAKYEPRYAALQARYLGSLPSQIEKLRHDAAEYASKLDRARDLRAAGASKKATYSEEADRELRGRPGYKAGAGRRYDDALAKAQAAAADLAKADADVKAYEPLLLGVNKQLDAATDSLKTAQVTYQREAEKLDREKSAELVSVHNDGMLAFIALKEVFLSPRYGAAAQHFAWLIMAVLMSVELAYLIVRFCFSPASIYTLRLIQDTKLRAEQIAAEYEREVSKYPPGDPPPSAGAVVTPIRFLR